MQARLLGAPQPAADEHRDPTTEPANDAPVLSRKADLSQIVHKVWWLPGDSQFELTWRYYLLARVLQPRSFLKTVAFGPSWFVRIDPNAAIPRFEVTKTLQFGQGVEIGPIATQADANKLVQLLEDAFDLCRYYHILEQAPNGQACAYFEMGRCPAPCDGTVPMSQYRETVARTVRFMLGERDTFYMEAESAMQAAAKGLQFEQANLMKMRLDRARGIEHASFRLLRRVGAFNYLIVQRGQSRAWVKPFFFTRGRLEVGEAVRLRKVDEAIPAWIDRMAAEAGREVDTPSDQRSHLCWLVAHYLFKPDPPGVFMHESTVQDAVEVGRCIRGQFTSKPVPKKTE